MTRNMIRGNLNLAGQGEHVSGVRQVKHVSGVNYSSSESCGYIVFTMLEEGPCFKDEYVGGKRVPN